MTASEFSTLQTNLLVDRDGHLVLSDLSTAVVQDDQAYMALIPNRATHVSFGSEYCSPELISPGLPTPQSDVWAWTCLACKVSVPSSALEPGMAALQVCSPALDSYRNLHAIRAGFEPRFK